MKKETLVKEIEALEAQLNGENSDNEKLSSEISELKKQLKAIEYEVQFGL